MILDQRGISFHAVIVFGLGKNLLFKSVIVEFPTMDSNPKLDSKKVHTSLRF